jgi:hypothetical protein
MDEFKPHLLIPEPEADYIDQTPPRGPKKEDVDHYEHGSVLSNGLQEIVAAYTKVQGVDSLCDEDIRVFEVLLPEGEKFSNKTLRDFIEGEGMSIRSVHDERRATVVTSGARFDTLQGRIGKYRDGERINKSFRDIEYFRFPDAADKQSPSIKEKFLAEVGSETLDVEIREVKLDDQVGIERQYRAEERLISRIKQSGGELRSEPFALADETRIIRAGITVNSLKEISADTLVDHVSPTSFYGTSPAFGMRKPDIVTLAGRNVRNYKAELKKQMKAVGTYKDEFEIIIDATAKLLADYDDAVDKFKKSGSNIIIKHTNKAKETNTVKNPFYLVIEGMRAQILKHLNELGLTPAGLKKINENGMGNKKESTIAKALMALG